MALIIHGNQSFQGDERPEFDLEEHLPGALERIHEEVRMARLLARQIDLRDTLAPHIVTALRESLLLRVFRLRQFFYGTAAGEGEVLAGSFFPEPGIWSEVRPAAPAHLAEWLSALLVSVEGRVRVTARPPVPEDAWPLGAMVETLVAVHEVFCKAIVEHHDNPNPETPTADEPWPRPSALDILPDPPAAGISDVHPGSH